MNERGKLDVSSNDPTYSNQEIRECRNGNRISQAAGYQGDVYQTGEKL